MVACGWRAAEQRFEAGRAGAPLGDLLQADQVRFLFEDLLGEALGPHREVVGGDLAQDFAGRLGEGADAFRFDRRRQVGAEVDVAGHHLDVGRRRRGRLRLRRRVSRRRAAPAPQQRGTEEHRRGKAQARMGVVQVRPLLVVGSAEPCLTLRVASRTRLVKLVNPLMTFHNICHTAT